MYIEISESKLDKLTECTEKMLKYGGKIMQMLDEMEGGEFGMRGGQGSGGSMGNRYGERGGQGGYGSRMGYRDEDDDDDEMMMMRERRGVRGSGRGRR